MFEPRAVEQSLASGKGVEVGTIVEGSNAAASGNVRVGDALLQIGTSDVPTAALQPKIAHCFPTSIRVL